MFACEFLHIHGLCRAEETKTSEKREWLRAMLFLQVLYEEERERTWRVWSTIHVPHAGLVG